MAESKFFPKLSQAEQNSVITSMTASEKFFAATAALERKLSRMDNEASDAMGAVTADVTSTTAHSDLSETVRNARKETDAAMDYFSSVMDMYRPTDGVMTRAQADAAGLTKLQTRNLNLYLKTDVLKVKYKTFLHNLVKTNRKVKDAFHVYTTKCRNQTDLQMHIKAKGVTSHEVLHPRDKADLSLSVVELERWIVEAKNWSTSSHFEYESLPVQLQYFDTVITESLRNILALDGKSFVECIDLVKQRHSKMNSKFTRRVQFLETKKTSSVDWLEYSTQLYNNGRLADVHSMTYDEFIVIKLTSEMPVELRAKIFTLKRNVDKITWPLFVQSLTNLVTVEKVTMIKKLAPIGNVTAKSGGKKTNYPNASSMPELVRKLGCLRCLGKHQLSKCTVPKTVVSSFCSKTGHQSAACFSKIRSELPSGHSALQVAAKQVPALPAPAGQEVAMTGGSSGGTLAAKTPPPALAPVPDMSRGGQR